MTAQNSSDEEIFTTNWDGMMAFPFNSTAPFANHRKLCWLAMIHIHSLPSARSADYGRLLLTMIHTPFAVRVTTGEKLSAAPFDCSPSPSTPDVLALYIS